MAHGLCSIKKCAPSLLGFNPKQWIRTALLTNIHCRLYPLGAGETTAYRDKACAGLDHAGTLEDSETCLSGQNLRDRSRCHSIAAAHAAIAASASEMSAL